MLTSSVSQDHLLVHDEKTPSSIDTPKESFFIDDEYKLSANEEEPEDKLEEITSTFNYDKLVSDKSKMYQLKNYYTGASNNFVRVYTIQGHQYWLAQACTTHRATDFKVHFSVHVEDIPRAYNLLAKHFYLSRCKFGMKAYLIDPNNNSTVEEVATSLEIVSDDGSSDAGSSIDHSATAEKGWPEHMRGREITVYIYRYHDLSKHDTVREYSSGGVYKEYSIHDANNRYYKKNLSEYAHGNPLDLYGLEKKHEESLLFYRKWIKVAEKILEKEGIRPNGVAFGDLPLGGKYASFRNETFVPMLEKVKKVEEDLQRQQENPNTNLKFQVSYSVDDLFVYPPNEAGWNASGNEDAFTVYEALRFNKVKLYDYKKWFDFK